MNFARDPIVIAVHLIVAALTAFVAQRKGRNVAAWFVLGLIFSIFALPVVLFLSTRKPSMSENGPSNNNSYSRALGFLGKVVAGVFLGFMAVFAANGGAGGSSTMSNTAWAALAIYLAIFLPFVVRWAKQAYKPRA